LEERRLSTAEIAAEQGYVSMLYGRLDRLRERAAARLAEVLASPGGTDQAMSERDTFAADLSRRIGQLDAAEHGLCFGRLDLDGGERRYVGRLGIVDDEGDHEQLLVDWRAPAARPFYVATAVAPDGVRRRRHIRTRLRRVVAVDDEVLDRRSPEAAAGGPAGEAALLAALEASRTGRMADIVETIQAEQDRVIRSPHAGVLVVQGGAGTGKTAVALHRVAYLLYTHREQLSRRGVLVVGPNPTFLRYIGQVLPSLGETGVVLASVGELFPGVTAERAEPADVAEVKGRPELAAVLAAAVRDRQRVPAGDLELALDTGTIRLDARSCRRVRDRARRFRRPHNEARAVFADEMVDALAGAVAAELAGIAGGAVLDAAELADVRAELRAEPRVWRAIDGLWPVLTPQRLLTDLFADPARLAAAAPGLTEAERALLHREPGGGWTQADVPLLDEAAELLGTDDRAARSREARRRRADVAAAQGVLDILAGSASHERDDLDEWEGADQLTAIDVIDAERLADRHGGDLAGTTAERAAADRSWTYGHVVVDEAQELSPMAWRLLMRRCPSRSMTLVGDVAQTGDLAGTSSWQRVLEPYVGDRWRLERLTVNYRMPAEVMAVAADVLAGLDPPVAPPRSVRETGVRPWHRPVPATELAGAVAAAVRVELAAVGAGRVAVLAPASLHAELARAVTGAAAPDLEDPVVVLTVRQAKGLEFDSVLVVEPAAVVAESPRGGNDLYVALTRATQRLGVVHAGPLPPALHRLVPAGEPAPVS
jgi:DNA helicase IV